VEIIVTIIQAIIETKIIILEIQPNLIRPTKKKVTGFVIIVKIITSHGEINAICVRNPKN
jgi:hypothetical protein